MSAESVQFAEMVRIEHARIEYLKQAADERGKEIERVTARWLRGEIDEQTYNNLLAEVCGQETEME